MDFSFFFPFFSRALRSIWFDLLFFFFWVLEVEMMKERFSKLLLGEDMSGGGKGVCTALAISNAITNLSGELC